MMYRASYLAVALTVGMVLSVGMAALEKHRFTAQFVANSPGKTARRGQEQLEKQAKPAAQPKLVTAQNRPESPSWLPGRPRPQSSRATQRRPQQAAWPPQASRPWRSRIWRS